MAQSPAPALVLVLAACLLGCGPLGEAPAPGPESAAVSGLAPDSPQGPPGLPAVGPVRATDSRASLVAAHGVGNVRDTALALGEGRSRPGVTLFPGTDEALTVLFEDPAGRRGVERVVLADPPSPHTVAGLRLGMSLEEAQAVNGGAFPVAGLGDDHGGESRGWGEAGRLPAAVTAVFRPRTRRAVPPAARGAIELASDDEAWRGLGMWLVELRVSLGGG